MLATSSLSVEIWQKILRYAIGVPSFFDPDAYEGVLSKWLFTESHSRLNDESAYWSAERTRNRLQRVCKSWDTYMRLFEHRYVRMLDVHHQKVLPEKLKRAIRISFGDYACVCGEYCKYEWSFRRFRDKALREIESMDVEIADTMQDHVEMTFLVDNSRKLKCLKTLIGRNGRYCNYFTLLVGSLPALRHFYGRGYRGAYEFGPCKDLVSESLVTLVIQIGPHARYEPAQLILPSLRHLRINAERETVPLDFFRDAILHILRCVGQCLLSLHVYHRRGATERLEELWVMCPQLRDLCTGFSLEPPPPYSHPINRLAVQRSDQLQQLRHLPEWPNLRLVRLVRQSWAEARGRCSYPALQSRADVRVQDKDGLTLDDFTRQQTESLIPSMAL